MQKYYTILYRIIIKQFVLDSKILYGGKMFNLVSNYKPTGDQPEAIEYLSKGIEEGKNFKLFQELQAQVKHLQWQMLFKKYRNQH